MAHRVALDGHDVFGSWPGLPSADAYMGCVVESCPGRPRQGATDASIPITRDQRRPRCSTDCCRLVVAGWIWPRCFEAWRLSLRPASIGLGTLLIVLVLLIAQMPGLWSSDTQTRAREDEIEKFDWAATEITSGVLSLAHMRVANGLKLALEALLGLLTHDPLRRSLWESRRSRYWRCWAARSRG